MRKIYILITISLFTLCSGAAVGQVYEHAWKGKRIGFLGDSITDPKCYGDNVKRYWQFLQEWLNITPYVYGVSGRQWNDIPRQAEALKAEHGSDVDAIIVFIGTNDFNHGVPIGEWYAETEDSVLFAREKNRGMVVRRHRAAIVSDDTYRGRINKGVCSLKKLFPNTQIVLLTPIHRSTASLNEFNVQPDEMYQNRVGEWFEHYVKCIIEAGHIWSVPVIDMNALCGLNPMIESQQDYFYDSSFDLLHPSTKGHERMAKTLMQQLITIPIF